MTSDYILEAQDLWMPRGPHWALEVPYLALQPGETLSLLGPNGAGKSTLVAVLAGLLPPHRGQVRFYGQPIDFRHNLAYRRRIAVVFQRPYLLRGTVEENVALGLRLHGYPKEEQMRRVRHWMQRLGIAHLALRSARKLSGGQAQRVALARALALEPQLLFLDEPFQALDLPTRHQLLEELQTLLNEAGSTTVYVTHDLQEALALAQRLAVLIQGRLQQVGPPEQVLHQPANVEVARVVGMETLLPGRVVDVQRPGWLWVELGGRIWLVRGSGAPGQAVTIGLRPEQVELCLDSDSSGTDRTNRLPARVRAVWPQPHGFRLSLSTPQGWRLVAWLPPGAQPFPAPGSQVEVSVRPEHTWTMPPGPFKAAP